MIILLQLVVLTSASLVALCHDVLPPKIDAQFIKLRKPPPFVGPLRINEELVNVEHLFTGKTKSQQSLVLHKGIIYTGTENGRILKIENDEISLLTQIGGLSCENNGTCGQPTGLRMHPNGREIIASDAKYGLLTIDIYTGEVKILLAVGTKVDGKNTLYFEDLDIDSNGIVYIAEASTKWTLAQVAYLILEAGPYGRVLRFDPQTGQVKVLLKDIGFCAGIQLTRDESSVLVSEATRARVLKLRVRGSRRGQVSVFADNLPGMPDNIRPSRSGGYWVPLSIIRQPDFSMLDYGAKRPWLREFLAKVLSPEAADRMLMNGGLIVELTRRGKICRSLQDLKAKAVTVILEVLDDNNEYIYLGSYYTDFLARKKI